MREHSYPTVRNKPHKCSSIYFFMIIGTVPLSSSSSNDSELPQEEDVDLTVVAQQENEGIQVVEQTVPGRQSALPRADNNDEDDLQGAMGGLPSPHLEDMYCAVEQQREPLPSVASCKLLICMLRISFLTVH